MTPSTTIAREPMNASSSTITGRALTGSSTPPMPAPPARWTFAPICAHEPTVAHVSTIVPGPDPGADVHEARHHDHALAEKRAVADDGAGDDAHATLSVPVLQGDLVRVLERPELLRLDVAEAEVVEDRLLCLLVHDPLVADAARRRGSRRGRARRPARASSLDVHQSALLQDPCSPLAVLDGRHEREARVALAVASEVRAGGDDDAVLEEAVCSVPRTSPRPAPQARGTSSRPCRRHATRFPRDGQQDVPLPPVRRSRARSTCPSSPHATIEARWTNSCGAVPTVGRYFLQCVDEPRRSCNEARPIPSHRRALAQRVEHGDSAAIRDLERRGGRLLEPELAVRLVRAHEEVVILGEPRELVEECRVAQPPPWDCSDS